MRSAARRGCSAAEAPKQTAPKFRDLNPHMQEKERMTLKRPHLQQSKAAGRGWSRAPPARCARLAGTRRQPQRRQLCATHQVSAMYAPSSGVRLRSRAGQGGWDHGGMEAARAEEGRGRLARAACARHATRAAPPPWRRRRAPPGPPKRRTSRCRSRSSSCSRPCWPTAAARPSCTSRCWWRCCGARV